MNKLLRIILNTSLISLLYISPILNVDKMTAASIKPISVQKGDTFSKIYQKKAKHLTFEEFKKINKHILEKNGSYDLLNINDKIKISKDEKQLNPYKISFKKFKQISQNKNITYNIGKIPHEMLTSKDYKLKIVTSEKHSYLSDIVKNAEIAINGSMFMDNYLPIGILKSEGKILNKHPIKVKDKGYLVQDKQGNMDITNKVKNKNLYEFIFESYPLIKHKGKELKCRDATPAFRSVVALDKHKNLYFITTENNLILSERANFSNIKEFINSQNYTSVLNLDGGISTSMLIKNQMYQKSYRKITNAIAIYSFQKK